MLYPEDLIIQASLDSIKIKETDIFEINSEIYSKSYLFLLYLFLRSKEYDVTLIESGNMLKLIKNEKAQNYSHR